MGRDATKAAGNPWYQARKKAAEYDDRLCSRESAAEQLGMSVSSLADAELGNTKFMPVDKAVLMADRYNAPWLLNHYCLNECPIGCRHSLSDEVVGIDRVTVKLLKSLKTEKLGDVKDTLLDIAADGKITEDEKPALQEVLAYLDDLAKTVSELKTIGEMALNEDGDAHGSKYSAQEMRASRLAGKSLDARKGESARYQIDALTNKIAWCGDEESGLMGVLSDGQNIPLYTIGANASGKTKWADKSADEILADVNGMAKQVAKITKNVERPDTLCVPADVFMDISTRRIPDTSTTVLAFIQEHAPYIKNVVSTAELDADSPETNPYATSGNPQGVAFLFKNDPRKLTLENPMPFYQYPLQVEKLETIILCEARTAGVIVYYPLSALIAVGVS